MEKLIQSKFEYELESYGFPCTYSVGDPSFLINYDEKEAFLNFLTDNPKLEAGLYKSKISTLSFFFARSQTIKTDHSNYLVYEKEDLKRNIPLFSNVLIVVKDNDELDIPFFKEKYLDKLVLRFTEKGNLMFGIKYSSCDTIFSITSKEADKINFDLTEVI